MAYSRTTPSPPRSQTWDLGSFSLVSVSPGLMAVCLDLVVYATSTSEPQKTKCSHQVPKLRFYPRCLYCSLVPSFTMAWWLLELSHCAWFSSFWPSAPLEGFCFGLRLFYVSQTVSETDPRSWGNRQGPIVIGAYMQMCTQWWW